MLNSKVITLLGALMLASLTIAVADQSQCQDCVGDSLGQLIDSFDQKRHCWFNPKHHDALLNVKLYTLQALVDSLAQAQKENNVLAEDKCQSNVQVAPCEAKNADALSGCQMSSVRSYIEAYRVQEQCHGQVLITGAMKIATRMINGLMIGWNKVHSDC